MNDNITGNKGTNNFQLLDVLMTLKNNIMKDLNVCEICKVKEKKSDYEWLVTPIGNDNKKIICFDFCESEINVDDIVLVVFTNTDNRINLNKIINNINTQNSESVELHSLDYGIITNKLKGEK